MDARLHVTTIDDRQQRMNKICVTRHTGALRDAFVARFNLDWVFVIAKCEGERVKKTVIGFRHPFADRIMRQMTIVTHRDVMVAAFLPRVQVFLHRVAVHAGIGVVAEITGTLAVSERERAYPSEQSQEHREDNCAFAEAF
jgi:hypothetical protein